jgi:D-lactate dehydrogenase
MKVAVCSAQLYDREFLLAANRDFDHELVFFDSRLSGETRQIVAGFAAVCVFVNDTLDAEVLEALAAQGTRLIAWRCAGFNNVDIHAANRLGLRVARVPAYSPYSVAEHGVGLMLSLDRHLHQVYNRVRNGNFALHGLLGFELRGRTAGIVGTGRIGAQSRAYCTVVVAAASPVIRSKATNACASMSNMSRWKKSTRIAILSLCTAP